MNFIYSNHIYLPDLFVKTSGKLTFTSLISGQSEFVFLDEHLERFVRGVAYFENYSAKESRECERMCKDFLFKEFKPHHYFRLLYANGEFHFTSYEHQPKKIETTLLVSYVDRQLDSASFIKDGNYERSFAEVAKAEKLGFDDVLFGNGKEIFEASTSNLLLVKNKKIYQSPKSENVFDGIFIKKLINFLKSDFEISEMIIDEQTLKNADEIWITNCVQGMRFVSKLQWEENKQGQLRNYVRERSLFDEIQKKIGRFGELINE